MKLPEKSICWKFALKNLFWCVKLPEKIDILRKFAWKNRNLFDPNPRPPDFQLDQRRQSGLKSGSRGSGSKNFDFLGKFPKNLDSFRKFHKQKINFSGQISEKFRFVQVISQKISILQVKFPKNFNFLRQFPKIFRFSRQFNKKSICQGTFKKNFDF